MREIKFRAWHIGEKRMYVDIAVLVCPNALFRVYDTYAQQNYIGNDKHCEIMQYTGLKDKNGVEIYEGDILESSMGKGQMKWDDSRQGWSTFAPLDNFEVVGNVYANPRLLEPKS